MYLYTWYQWLLFFFIYCFIGWIIESTYVSVRSLHFVNRGFLRLPLLPLYGSGAIIMLWLSLPVQGNLFLVFLFGMAGASALEYATGYFMERLFKMKYWDYSNNPFNLNGYVCLPNSIAWGFLTLLLTEVIHLPLEWLVLRLNGTVCILLVTVIGILFVTDAIHSTKEALDLGRILESMTKLKSELEEVQVQMALLKAETAQKVSDIRTETIQKAASLKDGTMVKISSLKPKLPVP
uniref:putative ABC transporter permease n=1 Tax=Clostridium sp. NkU-1 TaxID=1095009 RepID=UPI000A793100